MNKDETAIHGRDAIEYNVGEWFKKENMDYSEVQGLQESVHDSVKMMSVLRKEIQSLRADIWQSSRPWPVKWWNYFWERKRWRNGLH